MQKNNERLKLFILGKKFFLGPRHTQHFETQYYDNLINNNLTDGFNGKQRFER
jgi:hypothetical protein